MSAPKTPVLPWLCNGQEIFPAMLAAIAAARESVRLETYIYSDGKLGGQFLEALTAAARRGVRIHILVDAFGSWLLPGNFFQPLIALGAKVRRFNPLHFWRFGVRDHRKLLVCDDSTVFIGGFNIADEYNGDGVTSGWCDIGLHMENDVLAKNLAASFDELFALASFHRKPLVRLRVFKRKRKLQKNPAGTLLFTHPGRGASPFQTALYQDLPQAQDVRIMSAYFLPTRRVRRELMHAARRGARVQLILAGKSDVLISQLAARSLYHRLLKAGVQIYEYQPQVLHAKLILADDNTYVGSSNLDIRSLNLNYELMLRLADRATASSAREIFENVLKHSKKIELQHWRRAQTFWRRWKHHWAHFLLMRIDPLVALRQFRTMKK
jgi:cardiolipin synthase A/B